MAIKQAACLIACVTPRIVSTSFRLVTSNQRSPKTGDFVASKFYGKVPRPFFPPPQRKTEKSGLATRDYGLVGRPRKHEGGWECANKRICIANKTFIKWRRLKAELRLANDDAVACYLLAAVQSLSGARNKVLECERLVDSKLHCIIHWYC